VSRPSQERRPVHEQEETLAVGRVLSRSAAELIKSTEGPAHRDSPCVSRSAAAEAVSLATRATLFPRAALATLDTLSHHSTTEGYQLCCPLTRLRFRSRHE
jgi:hypothetical protein